MVTEKQRKARAAFVKNWAGKKRVTKTGKSKRMSKVRKVLKGGGKKKKLSPRAKAYQDALKFYKIGDRWKTTEYSSKKKMLAHLRSELKHAKKGEQYGIDYR